LKTLKLNFSVFFTSNACQSTNMNAAVITSVVPPMMRFFAL
jgi:hypothetical protein